MKSVAYYALKGGSCYNLLRNLRSFNSDWGTPDCRFNHYGFRLCKRIK